MIVGNRVRDDEPLDVVAGKLLLDLRGRLDRLEVAVPPFTRATNLPRVGAHWVRPEIVVQVAFIEWTVHGKLRHPRLIGVRFDKNPRDVIIAPVVSEKSYGLLDENKYTFEVRPTANKTEIKIAVEKVFNVKVTVSVSAVAAPSPLPPQPGPR